jgi:aspartate racemase
VDAVGHFLIKKQITTAGLLGTKFLMKSDTYARELQRNYQIKTVIPGSDHIQIVNEIIYSELVKGIIRQESRQEMRSIIGSMKQDGIEAIILGCTEIPLLINQSDCDIPVVNTTEVHAGAAVDYALGSFLF